MLTSRGRAYFKNVDTDEMDEKFGDLFYQIDGRHSVILISYLTIPELETGILHKLANEVLEREELLKHAAELCSEMDWCVFLK